MQKTTDELKRVETAHHETESEFKTLEDEVEARHEARHQKEYNELWSTINKLQAEVKTLELLRSEGAEERKDLEKQLREAKRDLKHEKLMRVREIKSSYEKGRLVTASGA